MSDRARQPVVVHGLIWRENKVLLMQRAGTGFADGYFSLPGGHVEAGELPQAALIRELREEVCLDLAPNQLRLAAVLPYATRKDQGVNIVFSANDRDAVSPPDESEMGEAEMGEAEMGEPEIGEPDRCQWLGFAPINETPGPLIPWVTDLLARQGLHSGADNAWYQEFDSR